MQECRLYLSELLIPVDFEVEIIEVTEAVSMAAGCNEGMRHSDAKYKVYLHQDVFIKNKNFIQDVISLFQKDEKIGLLGMVGTPYMVKTGTMWEGNRFGSFYRLQEYLDKGIVHRFFPFETGYMEVEAVDGLLMATQYDLPWREDLFQKWDFYDVSQSFEFLKAGYKVVVPGQSPEWYIHDCGTINLFHYDKERKKFLKYYAEYMDKRQEETSEEYKLKVIEKIEQGFKGTKKEKQRLIELVNEVEDKSEN